MIIKILLLEERTMNTYDKNSGNARSENAANGYEEEDLFLSGGFDSFSQDSTSFNGTGNTLGTASPEYGNTYYGNTNTNSNIWTRQQDLSFWEQLLNSFMPTKYHRYKGISVEGAKQFVRSFSWLYMVAGLILTSGFFLGNADMRAYLQYYNLLSLKTIIVYMIAFAIAASIYPFIFRLGALIMRLVGKLIALIEGKSITDQNMYLISVYSLVPWLIIKMFFIFLPIPILLSLETFISILDAVVPIIIMAIAIPHMEN